MNGRGLLRATLAVALVGWVAAAAASELGAQQKPTRTITGVVKAYETYRGKARSVYIEDAQQGEFLVVRGTTEGKALLGEVGATVKATGYVRKPLRESEFPFMLDVVEYEVVKPPAGKSEP